MNRVNIIQTNIPLEFFKSSVENHVEIKQSLLDSILLMGIKEYVDENQKIYNTDWNIPNSVERKYSFFLKEAFRDHFEKFCKVFDYTECSPVNYWFQQYQKGDYHGTHCHGESNFSCVYYVDLTEKNPKTTFVYRDKEYSFDVKEGDILTFPSYLRHHSPPNQSNEIKTVISMNVNVL